MRGQLVLMESGASLTKVVDLCVWLTSPGLKLSDIIVRTGIWCTGIGCTGIGCTGIERASVGCTGISTDVEVQPSVRIRPLLWHAFLLLQSRRGVVVAQGLQTFRLQLPRHTTRYCLRGLLAGSCSI